MKVTFFRQRPEGPQVVGTIRFYKGKLLAEPADIIALDSILAEPLQVYHKDGPTFIDPQKEPEAFLKALPAECRGTYFWCGPVED